jgi:integrase
MECVVGLLGDREAMPDAVYGLRLPRCPLIVAPRSLTPVKKVCKRALHPSPPSEAAGAEGAGRSIVGLRKSLSSWSGRVAGADIKTAQTRLGHANPAMTLAIYARATAEADRKAADAVGDKFRPRDARAMERQKAAGH